LRDPAPRALEGDEQLLLSPEPHPLDEARDETLPLGLRQHAIGLHKISIAYSPATGNV